MGNNDSSRESVITEIITIFIDTIGFFDEKEKASINEITNMAQDFKVDTDDLSLAIMNIEKHFSVDPSFDEWLQAPTIGEIADLIIRHLDKKNNNTVGNLK